MRNNATARDVRYAMVTLFRHCCAGFYEIARKVQPVILFISCNSGRCELACGWQRLINMTPDTLTHTKQLSALIEGCKRFDRRSQQLLYERYYGFALKVAFRYVDTYEQAVDAVQHSFLRIFRGFPAFAAGQNENLELSLSRWIRRNVVEMAVGFILPGFFACAANSRPEPMEGVLENDRPEDDLCRLIEALRGLPLVYRTIFNLHVMDGYSVEEVAALLGITVQVSELFVDEARVLLRNMDKVGVIVTGVP